MTRRFFYLLFLSAAITMLWKGCSPAENNVMGRLEFGTELMDQGQLKSTIPAEGAISAALVTITDASGRIIYDKEPVAFYRFGDAFITQSLALEVGNYQLSEFFLIDSSGYVMWASPLEGSELSHLVEHPLPLAFSIREQQTTTVRPQVVWIGDYTPGQFGYVSFDVDFLGTFCLQIMYDSYCGMVWADTLYQEMYESVLPPDLFSHIEIRGDNKLLASASLLPEFNSFRLSDSFSTYQVLVINCNMDTVYQASFSKEEILNYRCNLNNPLVITDYPYNPSVIITPEGLTEPTIYQGVFGRITIPMTDDSTYYFANAEMPVVMDLYIYPQIDYDSLYMFMDETGCCLPEYLPFDPLYIVRSNSDGFFELELEPGFYTYMVQLPDGGYYIDMYMNSRKGGELIIHEGEITKLYIQVVYYPMLEK